MTEGSRPPIPQPILDGKLIAILRGLDPARLPAVVDALVAGGIGVVEVTMNSADALRSIEQLRRRANTAAVLIGAGTVLDRDAAESAVAAGAQFLVAPHVDVAAVRWAAEHGVPMLPGAMTPSEVVLAWASGAAAVKVFPASVLGPAFVRELRGPLPQIPLIPTGGVSAESARGFLDAGAIAVGIGSWLTGSADPDTVVARARQLRAAIDPP